MESKYLKQFERLNKEMRDAFSLTGGNVVIEKLPSIEMKTAGGLIVAKPDSFKANAHDTKTDVAIVLLVGDGYVDEEGNDIKSSLSPGEIVMVPTYAQWFSTFPGLASYTSNTIALIHEKDVKFKFASMKAFDKCSQVLNSPQEF